MRRVFLAIVLTFGLASHAWADSQAGVDVNKQGDHATSFQFRQWKSLAERGDADAQFGLATLYEKGQGTAQDYAEAMKWYRKAGDQGDARALGNIGFLYENGWGVKKDFAEAVKWYQKAAKLGNAVSQNNLGVYYRDGLGLPKDFAKALSLFRAAAEKGLALAQVNLGNLYRNGEGAAKDYAEAAKWYRKAAEQNHAGAQVLLGVFYEYGLGVPQDYANALTWYRKAASRGNKMATKAVARMEGNPEVMRQVKEIREQRRLAEEARLAKAQQRYRASMTQKLAELRLTEEARRRQVEESRLPAKLAAELTVNLRLAEERRLEEDARLLRERESESKAILEEALRLPPQLLSYLFLASFYDDLWLRNSRAKFAEMKKSGKGEFKVAVTARTPDGKDQQFTLRTLGEIDKFTAKNRLLRIVYEKAITKRGFARFGPKYAPRISPECRERWFSSGEVSVQQNGFKLDISQSRKIYSGAVLEKFFSGVVVEDMVMVIHPPTSNPWLPPTVTPWLVGKFGKSVNLRDANSKCKITLIARLESDSEVTRQAEEKRLPKERRLAKARQISENCPLEAPASADSQDRRDPVSVLQDERNNFPLPPGAAYWPFLSERAGMGYAGTLFVNAAIREHYECRLAAYAVPMPLKAVERFYGERIKRFPPLNLIHNNQDLYIRAKGKELIYAGEYPTDLIDDADKFPPGSWLLTIFGPPPPKDVNSPVELGEDSVVIVVVNLRSFSK